MGSVPRAKGPSPNLAMVEGPGGGAILRVIYQYFCLDDAVVARRLDQPILFSMATLRACHPECEIVVLEYDRGRLDWQDFPNRLGFRVVRPAHFPAHHDGLLSPHMARAADAWGHASGLTCYSDSDVLWFDRIGPVDPDYVHINRSNSGLFLFDPTAYRAAAFMGLWAHACAETVRDQALRDAIRAASPEPYLHDESVYRHLWRSYPELLDRWLWILTAGDFAHPSDFPLSRAGRLHMIMNRCGVRRGSLAWLLRETRPVLEHYFTEGELREILGDDYPAGGMFSLDTLDDAIDSLSA